MKGAAVPMLTLAVLAAASGAAIAHALPAAHAQDGGGGAAMSIQELVDNAAPGGTVLVGPGMYANASVMIDKPLTLAASRQGAAVLTGNSSIAVVQGPDGPVAVSGLVFRDIACPAGGPGGSAVVTVGPGAGGGGSPGTASIRNNTFDGTCAAAVAAAPNASDVDVSGNTFRGIGAAAPDGATAPPPPAIRLGSPAQMPQGAQVSDSLVSSNYMFDLRGPAVQASGARGLTVVHNHVENTGSSAVVAAFGSSGVRVAYNTLIGSAAPALSVWADSQGALIMGNRISESAGALHVCAGLCEAGGAAAGAQPPPAGDPIRFHHNTLHASNTGALIGGNATPGAIDARSNYYPSYDPDPSRLAGAAAGSATAMPNGSAPSRIGALLAFSGLPYFDGVANDAAILEAAVRYNLAQVESGGDRSVEIARVGLSLDDPGAAASVLAGGKDDARYRPIMGSQIDSMRAAIDADGRDAAVAAVRAMDSPQEHYPFILNRTGHVQANGANPDRFDVVSPIASGDNPVPFAAFLDALDAAPPGAAMWYDYRISNFVHEGQPIESKRSLLSLHGLGTADPSDDLILGAGYYPRPTTFSVGPSASSSIEGILGDDAAAGLVLVSPSSLSPNLALPDTVYRLAPNDGYRALRVAEVMAGDGNRDIVAIVQDDAYGNAAYDRIRDAYGALSQGSVLPKVQFSASIGAGEWGPVAARANEMVLASSAANSGRGAAVLYIGFDPPFAGVAAEAVRYPALDGAQWYSTDLAGSPVVTGGGAALDLALSTRLKSVVFGVGPSDATRAVDAAIAARPGGGEAGDPRTAYAYAAHDAVLLIAGALAAGHSTPGAFAASLQGLAGAGLQPGGALGEIAIDNNGDLFRPGTFSTWEVSRGTEMWTVTGTSAPSLTCGISLASDRLDLGSVELGQAGEPRRQVVSNAGSAAMTGITLNATDWSSGLPVGATLFMAAAQGGSGGGGAAPDAFAKLARDSPLLGGAGSGDAAIAPGSSVAVDYRLDLTGMRELPPGASEGAMEQNVAYEVSCD